MSILGKLNYGSIFLNAAIHALISLKNQRVKIERFLTDAECARLESALFEYVKSGNKSYYSALAILMLLYTGCRKSEITQLQWKDVHLKERYLYFADSKTGVKTVPLNDKAIGVLRNIKKQKNNPHVFCGVTPETCIPDLKNFWVQLRNRINIPDVRIHDLRHSFASFALKNGVDLYTVSKIAGAQQYINHYAICALGVGSFEEGD